MIIEKISIPYSVFVVRDDLFPFLYGGNKARKALEYETVLRRGGYNAMVTTGGVQSNHCRVIALLAAKNNWKCHIVYHGSRDRFMKEGGNAAIVRMTNATYEFVTMDHISSAMDMAMETFRYQGYKPYYVTGGGHDLPGGIAYVKAVDELVVMMREMGIVPNRIFLPCGTGSTQAGIIVGLSMHGLDDTEVIGISVARTNERATSVTTEFIDKLADSVDLHSASLAQKVYVSDRFLYGGYEGTTPQVKQWLDIITKSTGIIFDTTYSGKALWGMKSLIEEHGWENDINLFWLTGGIFNALK